ncbi:hypothetical protein [Streptomyces rubiginosohelvolus]|uniref:hypothetical protein n=1 Tax=Streptomyces rubiginosohelvolus TaxID=67362 RepID=UPI0035E24A2A
MSRASIQDKFSENSALKMVQVLALVQACAEYARSINAPLPPEYINEQAWQEKVMRLSTPQSPRISKAHTMPKNQITTSPSESESLITPLINAGMEDIAHIATKGAGHPLEEWLPTVLVALGRAQMNYQGFLDLAVHEPPQQTVRILDSIAEAEAENVADLYFSTCLLAKPPSEIPKLLVALRRHDSETSYWYTDRFIDAIIGKDEWPGTTRQDLADVLRALRAATLKEDADKLAEGIGLHSWPKLALATAGSFREEFLGDRELILHAVPQGGPNRLLEVLRCLKDEETPGIDSRSTVEYLLWAVSRDECAKFSRALNEAEMGAEAQRLLELESEIPF